jgi:predicted transcriptional regulator
MSSKISFRNLEDKNIHLLSMIITYKPRSVYKLAKLSKIDVSNLNRMILFFEEFGVLKLKEMKVDGRNVNHASRNHERQSFTRDLLILKHQHLT